MSEFIKAAPPPPYPPGAARSLDLYFPAPMVGSNVYPDIGADITDMVMLARPGVRSATMIGSRGSNQLKYGAYRGRSCVTFDVALACSIQPYVAMVPPLARPDTATADPVACWSIRTALAVEGVSGAQRDVGLVCLMRQLDGNAHMTFGSFVRGFGVLLNHDGSGWRFVARSADGGPFTIDEPLAWPGAAIGDWSAVELRIIGATPTSDARVQVRLNGRIAIEHRWGATLPSYDQPKGRAFVPVVACEPWQAGKLHMEQLHIIAAPTEAALD